jgi:hypothetical protein
LCHCPLSRFGATGTGMLCRRSISFFWSTDHVHMCHIRKIWKIKI